jgi:AbrB family looped-hinge helix DNA binding protein
MPTATVTSKGQVTIPLAVRQDLRLEAGLRVEFTRNEDGSYSLRAATRPVSDLFGCLPGYRGPAISVDQMNQTMMDAAAEANR